MSVRLAKYIEKCQMLVMWINEDSNKFLMGVETDTITLAKTWHHLLKLNICNNPIPATIVRSSYHVYHGTYAHVSILIIANNWDPLSVLPQGK